MRSHQFGARQIDAVDASRAGARILLASELTEAGVRRKTKPVDAAWRAVSSATLIRHLIV